MNLTLGDAINTVARGLQVTPADPRVIHYINEATHRLLDQGKWKGSTVRYIIRTNGGILTLPTELLTCLAASRIGTNVRVRNEWFEFIGCGPGPQGQCDGAYFNLHDRGDGYVTINDIANGPVSLRIYADVLETAGVAITLMGWDENMNPIRTEVNGKWQDGETIILNPTSPATYVTSAFQWSSIAQIVKPLTNSNIRLYSVDDANNQTLLGVYGPSTRNPCFRRYELPAIDSFGTNPPPVLWTICKRRFVPALEPNDLLIIQNAYALKDAARAIMRDDAGDPDGFNTYMSRALDALNGELNEYLGDTGGQMDIQMPRGVPSLM